LIAIIDPEAIDTESIHGILNNLVMAWLFCCLSYIITHCPHA
jgi:hypothetical protein